MTINNFVININWKDVAKNILDEANMELHNRYKCKIFVVIGIIVSINIIVACVLIAMNAGTINFKDNPIESYCTLGALIVFVCLIMTWIIGLMVDYSSPMKNMDLGQVASVAYDLGLSSYGIKTNEECKTIVSDLKYKEYLIPWWDLYQDILSGKCSVELNKDLRAVSIINVDTCERNVLKISDLRTNKSYDALKQDKVVIEMIGDEVILKDMSLQDSVALAIEVMDEV